MNKISWSQFKIYRECEKRWKLLYIDKLKVKIPSVVLVFGTSLHEVLQIYLQAFYTKTIHEANSIDLNKLLADRMKYNYEHSKINNVDFSTKTDMLSFYYDGVKILDFLRKNYNKYFNKKNHSLLGIELKLDQNIKSNINFIGYIDAIIRDDDNSRIKIYDFKTSISGWNKWMKSDKNRTDQLLLYKYFYAKQYNIPLNRIDIEFFILKRKLYENVMYPQKRIQTVVPASGTPSLNKVLFLFNKFIDDSFQEDGSYNINKIYKSSPTKSACKYCEFRKTDLCNEGI